MMPRTSEAKHLWALCLIVPSVIGCFGPGQIATAVKEQVQREMADVRTKAEREVRAIREKAEDAVAIAQEKAEEIRAEAKEQIAKVQQEADERIRVLKGKLKQAQESVVNEGQVISDLHEDDRMEKHP